MNIQEIKTQLEELITKVNELEHSTSEYTFTKEEMIKFVIQLNEQFVKDLKSNIRNASFDADSIVDLDFDSYSRTIEVTIDESALANIIEDELVSMDEDYIIPTVDNIYTDLK